MPSGATQSMGTNDVLFGSFHPGGATFAYADGSVHFLPDDIDLDIYLALASKNGEEIVSLHQGWMDKDLTGSKVNCCNVERPKAGK